jgi:Tol biopolymer transport system component
MKRVIAFALALALAACREATEPFNADDFGERADTGGVRLTWNPATDVAPAWLPQTDSLIYSADAFPGIPIQSHGVLLAVPRAGGTTRIIVPHVQSGSAVPAWLTTPALTKEGQRIAFFQLNVVALPDCASTFCPTTPYDTAFTQPDLVSGVLRVRNLFGTETDIATLNVRFLGRDFDETRAPPGVLGLTILENFPFQRRFVEQRLPAFRPSWSPDGARLVFSDGLRLLLWTPGSSAPTALAGTDDATWPAWSPDNQWIAYSRLPRGPSTVTQCTCSNSRGFPIEVQQRTIYQNPLQPGVLTLIRPDGTGKRELGEGEAPAWLPDGSALIVRRNGALWRINPDGSGATQIAGTAGGQSPAVSSDGKYVAFAKRNDGRDWDIWTAPIQ